MFAETRKSVEFIKTFTKYNSLSVAIFFMFSLDTTCIISTIKNDFFKYNYLIKSFNFCVYF